MPNGTSRINLPVSAGGGSIPGTTHAWTRWWPLTWESFVKTPKSGGLYQLKKPGGEIVHCHRRVKNIRVALIDAYYHGRRGIVSARGVSARWITCTQDEARTVQRLLVAKAQKKWRKRVLAELEYERWSCFYPADELPGAGILPHNIPGVYEFRRRDKPDQSFRIGMGGRPRNPKSERGYGVRNRINSHFRAGKRGWRRADFIVRFLFTETVERAEELERKHILELRPVVNIEEGDYGGNHRPLVELDSSDLEYPI